MLDVWLNEAALSVSFNFLQNPASAGFLLSVLPAMFTNDTNSQICDVKHISLPGGLMNTFILRGRSKSQNLTLKNVNFTALWICYGCYKSGRYFFLI